MSPLACEPAVVKLDFPAEERSGQVIEYLRSWTQPVHLVGGTVRDLLLDRTTRDLDVAVEHSALALARRLADDLGGAFVPMDVARDTGRVVFSDAFGKPLLVDCAAWRGPTLEDDLRHRDFTVNALAVLIADDQGGVIDVTGGLADLRQGLLKLAYERSLADDPLRGLRAVRLAAELSSFGFRLEHSTEAALRGYAVMLTQPASERVRDELMRILSTAVPDTWLRLMADLDQLSVVLPELAALRSLQGWDAFAHSLATLHYASALWRWLDGLTESESWPDREMWEALETLRPVLAKHFAVGDSQARTRGQMLMWAALAQDWGLPLAQDSPDRQEIASFLLSSTEQHLAARLATDALHRLRFNEAEVRRVATIVTYRLQPLGLVQPGDLPGARMVHRYFQTAGDAGVDIALLSLASHRALGEPDRGLWQWHLALVTRLLEDYFDRHEAIIAPQPLIDGNDLMEELGMQPGRWVGHLLAEVAEAQAAGELHSRDEALALAARQFRSLQQRT